MKFSTAISLAFLAAPAVNAFTAPSVNVRSTSLSMSDSVFSTDIAKALDKEVSYHVNISYAIETHTM